MKVKILRSLACGFFVLFTAALLRADRDADRRKERIPISHKMHPPQHHWIVPFASTGPTGCTPAQLRHAYGFDQLNTTGAGQIIAIVDAYGSPTIQADLNTFCAQFNIPTTTVEVYYPQGTPPANTSWATETSLDVEWAHAIAPGATIALIVSKSNSTADLFAAVDYAVSIGAKQVSMSWGGSEFSTETTADFHFNVPGVTFLASSGDSGAGVSEPASSPYVVGVGGTTLNLDSSGNITSETAWSGSGGGASAYEPIPSYQAGWLSGTQRGVPDVAYDANPATGVPIYLTGVGWAQYGGTSMSAPQWAALFALANSLRSQSVSTAPGALYSLATANYVGYYHDIISGSNGNSAGIGYDLVTGLGSPQANQLVLALAGGFSSQVAAPAYFSPAGSYSSTQNITIVSATPGTSIRYTTDGSTPSETIGTVYSGAVSISANTTLKAIAYEPGFTDSPVTSGSYTFFSQVATPAFSPIAGTYTSVQTVTISTATSGASIRYTTDGSTPTETIGTLYSGPVSISSTAILNVIAYKVGFLDSAMTSGTYTIIPPAAAPVFSPAPGTYTSAQTITITSATSGATIRYTTSGTPPNETIGTVYSGPIGSLSGTVMLKAIAYMSGFTDSTVTSGTYSLPPPTAAPTFSPVAGTYTSTQTVAITSATSGATIRYTTNGSTPSETLGTVYSGPVSINSTTTLMAIAYKTGSSDSPITSGTYTINFPPVAAPVFNPAAGTYTNAQTVTITSATSGATIRYTTNGSIPSETIGTLYSGPVSISSTTMLAAIAYKAGFSDSALIGGTYTINYPPASAPVFSPAAGTYANAQTVTITSATSGATFRYTTDGSTPTETNGTIYSGPVNISRTTMLKAIAYGSGFAGDSPVTGGLYTITSSPAIVLNVIHDFTIANNGGYYPYASLAQSSDGSLYGTTAYGGSSGDGTLFKITPAGILTTLLSFSNTSGADPYAGLIQGGDGNFYGPTYDGGSAGYGTVFKLTSAGVLTTLASFNFTNGAYPQASLVQGNDGNFYGMTESGGSAGDGTVFKLTPAGTLTTLVSFNVSNGAYPNAGLIQGSDGNFYGTTASGGSGSAGTVFRLTPAGILTTLVSFNVSNGAYPYGSLVQGSDGNFYGTTENGGPNNNSGWIGFPPVNGTVFKLTPAGVLTTLVSFEGYNGAYPLAGLVQGSDGNFYGTTEGGGNNNAGTIFQMTPAGVLTTLASFDGANGYVPQATVVQGSDGNFYGTSEGGGISNEGVVFQLIIPSATAPVFSPAAGTYTSAQTVTISTTPSSASIRYTTDGSTPSETNGTLYSSPVSISATTTLKAIAYEPGLTDSSVASGVYTITPAAAPPSSGGGGGGAFDDWFLGFLAFAGLWRWRLRKTETAN